jgi:hypothetical protein
MARFRWRKASVLLQTLVMTVLISMMGVMVLKWVLGRYMFAVRNFHSATTRLNAQGFSDTLYPAWYHAGVSAPTSSSKVKTTINTVDHTQCVVVKYAGPAPSSPGASGVVTITSDEDTFNGSCP